ncbi:MAG: hypothetical protein B6D36_06860 [Planctomycetes bacterium UTPLA1]|jgi:hypothetical protein|nr:MAG: hypothetical protein B6D36_06860 [Planctomycetes bacterium UTPLA1]
MITEKNTNPIEDALDLMDTLDIKKLQRRTHSGGAWVSGTIGGHRFEALVFAEHAENPAYEIDDSRISKLWLQRIEDRATVYNWDRGMDIEAATPIAQKIVDLLAAGLAEFIYGS